MKKTILYAAMLLTIAMIPFGSFSQVNYYGVTGNMLTGDFDNDGLMDDIAAFNTSEELPTLNLWVFENGNFKEQLANLKQSSDLNVATSINSKMVAGDFDNDGFIDDIAAVYAIGVDKTSMTVWINHEGVFTPKQWWYGPDFDANQIFQTMVCGDFDNDGYVDDVAAFYNYKMKSTKVFVWLSDTKQFGWPGTWWIGSDFDATRIQGTLAAGDFDQDGFKDDIAALYNYADGYCKAFVWTPNKNKFNWPYTWFSQPDFFVGHLKGNLIAGDFDQNGFEDNLAMLYQNDENSSSILVFTRNKTGFNEPETWWYGTNEAFAANSRLVVTDLNDNKLNDQFTGLLINGTEAELTTWTAENNQFTLPETLWQGIALSLEDCNKNGGCLSDELSGNLIMYPNPGNGQVNIEIPKSADEQVSVSVSSLLGNQLMKFQIQSGQILPLDLTHLKAGTYLVQITGNDMNLKQNLIIQ